MKTYSFTQIQADSLPPDDTQHIFYPSIEIGGGAHADNIYHITGYMARFFFWGEKPDISERHDTMRNLSSQAAVSGIPYELWLNHIEPLTLDWYAKTDETYRITDLKELIKAAQWAYNKVAELGQTNTTDYYISLGMLLENSVHAVRVTDTEFVRLVESDLTREVEKITTDDPEIPVDTPLPHSLPLETTSQPDPALFAVQYYSVEAIRPYIASTILKYTQGIAPDDSPDCPNSILLLKASPGSGKTHASLNLLSSHANGAFLSLFKLDSATGHKLFESFNVDPSRAIFIEARTPDEKSAGYCLYSQQAEKLGNKGENVIKSLCFFCNKQSECSENWYLSQFTKTVEYPVLVARHNHGRIKSIMQHRDLIIFDESPLDVVAKPIVVKAADIRLPRLNQLTKLEFEVELSVVDAVLKALQDVITNNFPVESTPYPTEQTVKLGGRWLMEKLIARTGIDYLEKFISYDYIPRKVMNELTSGYRLDNSLEAVDLEPPNFIKRLRDILQHEYRTYFLRGCQRWNSRLIPYGNELRVYEMLPFKLDKNARVIITDATGLPEYYPIAFTDSAGKPRKIHNVAPVLEPRSTIIQYTGTDNTKNNALHAVRKVKAAKLAEGESEDLSIPRIANSDVYISGAALQESEVLQEIVLQDDTIDQLSNDPALIRCKGMIEMLSKKHNGSLLVVTYKEFAVYLKLWAKKTGVLNPDYIQWFGNLKGRNDYEMLESCLVFGTPRVAVLDLLIAAQVWNWQDPEPIYSETTLHKLKFKGYKASDGKGRVRQYRGYVDPRVNKLYVHSIQSEMRQCYERIRPDSSTEPKFVYIDSAFPCTDYLTDLVDKREQAMQSRALSIFEIMLETTNKVFRSAFVMQIRLDTGCSEAVADKYYEDIIKSRTDLRIIAVEKISEVEKITDDM